MKVYETPAVEIVEMELQGIVCASTNDDNIGTDTPETEDWN